MAEAIRSTSSLGIFSIQVRFDSRTLIKAITNKQAIPERNLCCASAGHWCSARSFAVISWLLWSRLAGISRRGISSMSSS
ncbi:unnamed protein product [Brassica rapa subsp. trilocularis]